MFVDTETNEPFKHEDGTPVTVEDMEASQLRQEMVEFTEAMSRIKVFLAEVQRNAQMRLADNMIRIMAHDNPVAFTWEEWVDNTLYPEC